MTNLLCVQSDIRDKKQWIYAYSDVTYKSLYILLTEQTKRKNKARMKKIGLVLAGGGGRGAYHIGVWKALRETGLDKYVSAISGTSVGGLNAALFLQGDFEKAVHIWEHISAEKILTPKYGFKQEMQHPLDYEPKKYHGMYLCIRSGLSEIIRNNLDMSVFDSTDKNCYMACRGRKTKNEKDMDSFMELFTQPDGTKVCKKYVNGKATYFNMRSFSPEDRENILLATSAMPFIFPKEKIGGYDYMDGGSADNLPVEPLYRLENCEIIIVVHLATNERLLKVQEEDFPNAAILQIRPKHEQGGLFAGILDFNAESAKRRMRQGYDDNIGLFRSIEEMTARENASVTQWKAGIWKELQVRKRREMENCGIEKMLRDL